MSSDSVKLDLEEQALVAEAFATVVREQQHAVFAATIQRTHVHLIFGPVREDIKIVIARLKRRSAGVVLGRRRELIESACPARMAGLYSRAILARQVAVPRSLWTAGQFPVFIFDEFHLANAIEYVRDHNRRQGLAADPYDGSRRCFRLEK